MDEILSSLKQTNKDSARQSLSSDKFFQGYMHGLSIVKQESLTLVHTSYPARAEPNTIKFGNGMENIKVNRFLPNLIIKFDLYVELLPYQCRT